MIRNVNTHNTPPPPPSASSLRADAPAPAPALTENTEVEGERLPQALRLHTYSYCIQLPASLPVLERGLAAAGAQPGALLVH